MVLVSFPVSVDLGEKLGVCCLHFGSANIDSIVYVVHCETELIVRVSDQTREIIDLRNVERKIEFGSLGLFSGLISLEW